jgi:hypothetical protein
VQESRPEQASPESNGEYTLYWQPPGQLPTQLSVPPPVPDDVAKALTEQPAAVPGVQVLPTLVAETSKFEQM